MIIWGVSADNHDAAIAVFTLKSRGLLNIPTLKLEFASQTERFSGIKGDQNLNKEIIEYATQNFGEPEQIIWHEKPLLKIARQIYAKEPINLFCYPRKYIDKYFNKRIPIKYIKHHHSHAANGYYTSRFSEACVVTLDAIGEFETFTIWKGTGDTLEQVYSEGYPHSLGLWYSAMTQRVGLKPNEEEYILMGMAAIGDPDRFYHQIKRDFFTTYNNHNIIGMHHNIHQGCLEWMPSLEEKDYFDVAAATQKIYEECLEKVLELALQMVPSKNIVFSGGCALNCVANNLLFKYFEEVWIPPNPGDAGNAIGAVLAKYKIKITPTNYLGYDLNNKIDPAEVARYLNKYKVCGVATGKAEFGPRALGNRSLLGDPRVSDIKSIVNLVKNRQTFRPFAPVILQEDATQYFEFEGQQKNYMYMQFTATCKYPEKYPGICHIDGTSRVQMVSNDFDSQIKGVLKAWKTLTGCPMLLNTSLNVKGKPIVNTKEDCKKFSETYGVKIFS